MLANTYTPFQTQKKLLWIYGPRNKWKSRSFGYCRTDFHFNILVQHPRLCSFLTRVLTRMERTYWQTNLTFTYALDVWKTSAWPPQFGEAGKTQQPWVGTLGDQILVTAQHTEQTKDTEGSGGWILPWHTNKVWRSRVIGFTQEEAWC